jgi:hypothetical protein
MRLPSVFSIVQFYQDMDCAAFLSENHIFEMPHEDMSSLAAGKQKKSPTLTITRIKSLIVTRKRGKQ